VDVDKALAETAKGVKPVYVFHGGERVLIDRAVAAIRDKVFGAAGPGLGEDRLDAKDTTPAHVVDACRSVPMFAPKRLVIVRGIEGWSSEQQEVLLGYVAQPAPTSVLILMADGKLDKRFKFVSQAAKLGVLYEASAPGDRDVGPWLVSEAQRRNMRIAPRVVHAVVEAVGADLAALTDALERLQLFAGERDITEEDVDEVVASTRAASIFELTEAIGDRDLPRALRVHGNLVAHREASLRTLAMLVRQVRMIARTRDALERGSESSLASVLKIPPFAAQRLATQARRWTTGQVVRALRVCSETDRQLKRSRRGDSRIMEEALIALTGGPGLGEVPLAR